MSSFRSRASLLCTAGLMLGLAATPMAQRTISESATPMVTDLELVVMDQNNVHSNTGVNVFNAQAVAVEEGQVGVGKYVFQDIGNKVVIRFPDRGMNVPAIELVLDEVPTVFVSVHLDGNGGIKSITQTNNRFPGRSNPFNANFKGVGTGNASGPPANDDCTSATVVGDGATAYSNLGATDDGPANCAGTFGSDVWFSYTATCDGTLTASTCNAADYDTAINVYDGGCGALNSLGCNDDGPGCAGFSSELEVTVVSGTAYLIQVGGFNGASGSGTLTLTCEPDVVAGPLPDECEDAELVNCGDTIMVNNETATENGTDPAYDCRVGGADTGFGTLWYKFVATDTEAFLTTLGSPDTLLAVYSGECGSLVEICCNDDDPDGGLHSTICCEGLTIGDTYFVQLSSWSDTGRGDLVLSIECPCPAPPVGRCCLDTAGSCVETDEEDCLNTLGGLTWDEGLNCTDDPCPVAPDNDDCDDAEDIAGLPFVTVVDNTGATTDGDVACGVFSGPFNNVWYTVTGNGGTFTVSTCNGNTVNDDTKISVFCADCVALECVDGNDDDCTVPPGTDTFQSTVSWCTQNGAEYLISVGSFSATGSHGDIEITVTDDGGSCVPDVQCLPIGACCIFDGACGSCVELTEDECTAAGGVYQGDDTVCSGNLIADPGFENFDGSWTEASSNFGTPLCSVGACGTGGGTPPFEGDIWAWFGGISGIAESGSVEQSVVIPAGSTSLTFYYQHPVTSANGVDFMRVLVDGNVVASFPEGTMFDPTTWTQIPVNIAAFADGGAHLVRFESTITGFDGGGIPAVTNFFVDLVELQSQGGVCDPTCVNVDFETEDDFSTALADGQDLSTPPEFGNLFDISGAGANEGPAIFDSSVAGPNDPGSGVDPDLIVGQGNILILQDSNSAFQTNAGFYDVPNDAKFGGTLIFDFNQGTLCESIDLIDVDNVQPDAQVATVTLTDAGGLQRVYTAPDGYTEDIETQGGTGVRTLDLTTLAAQPGFAAAATATEDAGFNACNVVKLEVNFAGSSAVDNLSVCTQ